ncbi:MAG: inositol monophosphatase family protein [Candidatus Marinimicrobia bacterium]|nr:inositol monophosphatase family protein [Candidatus Neomarinimicrobiota bacterium]MDD5540229.1 inositol monophosphatase family protein [Candidatus Neomarinimicrobiota bacterium]
MIDASLQKQLTITALSAAQLAGRILREKVNTALEVDFKGRVNLVTEADRSAEKIIIDTIYNHFPEHQILAEESPFVDNGSEFKWIIDPLDGTTNFVHGFPFFSISIGLEYRRELILGVVSIPLMNETFRAFKDSGAFLNDKPIQVSKVEKLAGSLLATGFPYENNVNFQRNFELFRRIYPQTQGVRRAGSAAIDLCYTACGRFDGFWELDLNAWDVAAGALIVMEAGGRVINMDGSPFSVYDRQILATNGLVEAELLSIFKK